MYLFLSGNLKTFKVTLNFIASKEIRIKISKVIELQELLRDKSLKEILIKRILWVVC